MNSFGNRIFDNQVGETDTGNDVNSYGDFMRELEERERDLHITAELPIIQIAKSDEEEKEIAELEKFLELYEDRSAAALTESLGTSPEVLPEIISEAAITADETADLAAEANEPTAEYLELVDAFRRKEIDFNNLKNRTEREKEEIHQQLLVELTGKFLPVLDNLERALNSTKSFGDKSVSNFEHFVKGVVLVKQQFEEVLSEIGVSTILAVGEVFDPNFHEATAVEYNKQVSPNTVTEEILPGYYIKDKVIRHSLVKVSQG